MRRSASRSLKAGQRERALVRLRRVVLVRLGARRVPALLAHRALPFSDSFTPRRIYRTKSVGSAPSTNISPRFSAQRMRRTKARTTLPLPSACPSQSPIAGSRAFRAGLFGPGFRQQRDARAPFAAHRETPVRKRSAHSVQKVASRRDAGKERVENTTNRLRFCGRRSPRQSRRSRPCPSRTRDADYPGRRRRLAMLLARVSALNAASGRGRRRAPAPRNRRRSSLRKLAFSTRQCIGVRPSYQRVLRRRRGVLGSSCVSFNVFV